MDFLPELDLMTLGVFVLSFGVCAALVAFVSLVGAKEQTFEEALEEQRKRNKQAQEQAAGNKAKNKANNSSSSSAASSSSGANVKRRATGAKASQAKNKQQQHQVCMHET